MYKSQYSFSANASVAVVETCLFYDVFSPHNYIVIAILRGNFFKSGHVPNYLGTPVLIKINPCAQNNTYSCFITIAN